MMNEHEELDPVLGSAIESWRTSEPPPAVMTAALLRITRRPPSPGWRQRLWPILPAVAAGVTIALMLSAIPAAWAEVATVLQPHTGAIVDDPDATRARMRPWLIIHVGAALGAYLVFVLVWAMTQFQVVLGLFGVRRWETRVAQLAPISMAIGAGLWLVSMVLGAVWARSVLGRYWAWDPKEVSAVATLVTSLVWLALAWKLRGFSFPWPAVPGLLFWLLLDFWWGSLAQTHTYGHWLSATLRCILCGALLNVVLPVSAWWTERNKSIALRT